MKTPRINPKEPGAATERDEKEMKSTKTMGAITQNESSEALNWEPIVPTSINRCVNPSMHLSMINMSIHQSIDA